MTWFNELIHNPFLITAVSSWAIAQVLKVLINAFMTKKFSIERLFGDGGMPSGHSATVSSLAAFTALRCGLGSFEFAVTAVVAIIVCHDAMGVRLETGKQAAVLNEIIKHFESYTKQDLFSVTLKEFVGHTPSQVCVGILLGIANAFTMHHFLP